jgi:hypothetical protein
MGGKLWGRRDGKVGWREIKYFGSMWGIREI